MTPATLPTPRPPLMTAEERFERAKTHTFIRASLALARVYSRLAAKKETKP